MNIQEMIKGQELLIEERMLSTHFGQRITINDPMFRWASEKIKAELVKRLGLDNEDLPLFWGDMDSDLIEEVYAASFIDLSRFKYQQQMRDWFKKHHGVSPIGAVGFKKSSEWTYLGFMLALWHEQQHSLCHKTGCECETGEMNWDKRRVGETHADCSMITKAIAWHKEFYDPEVLIEAMFNVIRLLRKPGRGEDKEIHYNYKEAAKVTISTPTFQNAWNTLERYGLDMEMTFSYWGECGNFVRVTSAARKEFWTLMGRADFNRMGRIVTQQRGAA